MKKILFLIHDLNHGGAEKVLINLVNHMDCSKFDITVMALFGGGVNEQFLSKKIRLINCHKKPFRGNSQLMKLFSPQCLYHHYIKEHFDIIVSYLEGSSARIVSGCMAPDTKLISWVHCTMHSKEEFAVGFRSYQEAVACFSRFHSHVFVSREVMAAFQDYCLIQNGRVLYNTNESDKIIAMSQEPLEPALFRENEVKLISVGKIEIVKGYDRLARVHRRLIQDGYPVHTYILGEGSQKSAIVAYLEEENLTDSFTFLGYQTNPYKFVKNGDLFVCSSLSEGFSTAATEALIVGTPVVTTLVSGMKEMLGEHNEWGIVTENSEDALYLEIKRLLDNPQLLLRKKEKAAERGRMFSTVSTIKAVEDMMLSLP